MLDKEFSIIEQVVPEHAWDLVTTFAGRERWRPEDVNSAGELIGARLRALGLPVVIHRPIVALSIPLSASVTLDGEEMFAKPPSSSKSCPEGVSAELFYIPANKSSLRSYNKKAIAFFGEGVGTDDEMRARVAGKILITEGFGNPALAAIAMEWGAVGLIAVNPGVDTHWGTCTTVWGSPDLDDFGRKPTIPVIAVNKLVGGKLIERAKAGATTATIKTEMQEGWFEQAIPTVEIPGTVEAEKFVFLHGHYDSWDVGVGDNATGDAAMLEIARALWENRDKLYRSVRIAWWPGHSTGRYAGSTWYSDAFALDLDENCVMQINCDSPGCRWATSYHATTAMPETFALVKDVIEKVAGQTPIFDRPHQAGDYSFNNIGISSFFMLSSTMPDDLRAEKGYYAVSGCGGNIAWHTENDTMDIADKDILMTDIKIYLDAIWRVANTPLLPVDWRETTKEFAASAATYTKAAGDAVDLSAVVSSIKALDDQLAAFYAAIAAGAIATPDANEVLMRLARILIPVNYTTAPRFTHDPAITRAPLPLIEKVIDLPHVPEALYPITVNQIIRGANRTAGAMREATRLIKTVM
ncbi:Peptidase, M28 family protein (plasmid) [Ketogulonicigenium vulgare WSH-001]|uniref:Peptidase, M28 family protein n=1 Tax=Ketogulonicigenium vulgare (strain WSH-001) TaxID=759362 RepID=F9YBR9_KETVW|nr:Peptidase, M28 family protein [Ketogulonicigenium vulgare WSH-001]ALJ82750.1 peptidase M28 [Ketogulonicigenium vulgare]